MIAEQKEELKIWRSCCFKLNSEFTTYISKIVFSIFVLGICTMMLIHADGDCSKSSPYINIISFLCGKILSDVMITHK